ncbi:hypothetical protein EFA46_015625 (plasmid) [Halarchaeum sp. CBA1220]|uniref:hypothetical protein n=1 Tax=Halarchaeum sp. CBA1220 TaxID=1853682 RepID=UPI000F3AA6CB|nr:hypothetical protein [Halarchaeum sp. CBA1220]QLC35684.1 hypothetical protein EFA46_015625 [Halarchaeum sp. CBA1220]
MSEPARLSGSLSKTYAERLLTADTPSEVSMIITQLEEALSDQTGEPDIEWVPLGHDENNYSDVYTQASSPMAAFSELPLNAEDSLTLRFYEGALAVGNEPIASSMKEATRSDWVDLDDAELEIIADGLAPQKGNHLNLTVRDNGKGKARTEFEDFVGLHAPGLKKQEYDFLQGQYGMGSTAVMQFTGKIEEEYNERAFKFIASASVHETGEWSWTLIHDKPHKSQVEYLTVNGEFPVFDGTFGGALTEKFRESYPEKYDFKKNTTTPDPQSHGAFVKVYDYQTNASRTMISGDEGFRHKFERSVVDSPYPIQLTDLRYNSKFPQSSTRGFLQELENGHEHLLEGKEHLSVDTGSETLGERDITVLLFKDDDELEDDTEKSKFVSGTSTHKDAHGRTGVQKDHAVMLTINGQTHASKGEYFLKSLGYSKVASDTVVIVKFDDLANLGMVNMFSPSRDTLKDSPQANKFLSALENALEGSDLLTDEEERRRAQRGNADPATDTETFAEFIERNPEVGNFMATGERIRAPRIRPSDEGKTTAPESATDGLNDHTDTGTGDAGKGDGPHAPTIPTYLTPIKQYDPGSAEHVLWVDDRSMPVEIPVNAPATIRFETDAQSDYLTRDVLSGSLEVSHPEQLHAVELQDGLLTLTVTPADDADPGETFPLLVTLTRPDPQDCPVIDQPTDAYPKQSEADTFTDGGVDIDTSPLTASCSIEYSDEVPRSRDSPSVDDKEGEEGTGSAEDGDAGADDRDGAAGDDGATDDWGFEMPDIAYVHEENWRTDDDGDPIDPEEFNVSDGANFDEHTLIHIDPSQDGTISGLSLTINMDAAALRSFIVHRDVKDNWKGFVEQHYELAMVFYTITMYRDYVEEYGTSVEGTDLITADVVARSINALAPTLMPTIIPDDQINRITE